ncbi:MAG: hypothetical protein ACM3KL_00165, partial [Alphaproteobacteria bacterium]
IEVLREIRPPVMRKVGLTTDYPDRICSHVPVERSLPFETRLPAPRTAPKLRRDGYPTMEESCSGSRSAAWQ